MLLTNVVCKNVQETDVLLIEGNQSVASKRINSFENHQVINRCRASK